ncbi:9542_t:CDS:2 [Entrophospora sp. SA101]|nr:9542_t:CDS:2 [Entrophospora sp. SA101]
MTKLYEGFNDIPSTTNKINLLYVLVGLSLLFLLILIPLNKIADYESKRGEESLNHPCANEFFSDIEVQRLQQSAIEIVNNESKLNLLNKVNIYDQDTQYIGESLDAFGEWVHVYNGETHIEGTVDMHLIGPFSKTPGENGHEIGIGENTGPMHKDHHKKSITNFVEIIKVIQLQHTSFQTKCIEESGSNPLPSVIQDALKLVSIPFFQVIGMKIQFYILIQIDGDLYEDAENMQVACQARKSIKLISILTPKAERD